MLQALTKRDVSFVVELLLMVVWLQLSLSLILRVSASWGGILQSFVSKQSENRTGSAVMWTLYWSVMVMMKLTWKL